MRQLPRLPILACGNSRARKFGPDLSVPLIERQLGFDASEAVAPDDGFPDMEAIAVLDWRKVVVAVDAHADDFATRPALHIEVQAAPVARFTGTATSEDSAQECADHRGTFPEAARAAAPRSTARRYAASMPSAKEARAPARSIAASPAAVVPPGEIGRAHV